MSKKVLSVVIAAIMVLSVFSVSAFAITAPASGEVGILVESDALIGQKDGVVNVSIYWVFPSDTDFSTYLATVGNICLGINSAKYSYVADSRTWQGEIAEYELCKTEDSYVRVAHKDVAGVMKTVYSKLSDNDKKYGYDTSVLIQTMFNNGNSLGTSAAKGWKVTPDANNRVLVCTLQFNVLGELGADDAIGVIDATIAGTQTQANYSNGTKQVRGAAINSGVAVPAIIKAAKDGAGAVTTLAGWGNYLADSDIPCGYQHLNADSKAVWCLAVKATFSAADINAEGLSFTDKVSNDIASLNATVKIGDTTLDGNTKFIYDNGDGTYSYYVVLQNLPEDVTDTATITFGGTLVSGGDIKGETVTVDLAAALAAAKFRGMPETAPNAPAGHSAEA